MLINSYRFSPETDQYYNSVSLLLHGNGTNGSTTITDNSPSPKTVTAFGDARISTVQSKFGGASIAFDGNGDYLTTPDSTGWDLSGDFTIEAWVYLAGYSNAYSGAYGACVVAQYNSTPLVYPIGWQLRINGTALAYNTINLFTGNTDLNFASSIALYSWNHIAVTRSSGSIKAFVNGMQAGSTVANSDSFTEGGARPLWIGALNDSSFRFWLNGYIDELRITKGIARYTTNFTPPTAPFPDS